MVHASYRTLAYLLCVFAQTNITGIRVNVSHC